MKKHELLKYAYDNYPKGCVAKFKGIPAEHTSDGIFQLLDLNNDGNIGVFSGEGFNCFYCEGEWAEIVSDKKPLLISEDGVKLFEKDYWWNVYKIPSTDKWTLGEYVQLPFSKACIDEPERFKAFTNKQKALEWVKKANKPKETHVQLYFGQTAIIKHNQSEIIITDKDGKTTLSFGDIMDLYSLIHRNGNKESI